MSFYFWYRGGSFGWSWPAAIFPRFIYLLNIPREPMESKTLSFLSDAEAPLQKNEKNAVQQCAGHIHRVPRSSSGTSDRRTSIKFCPSRPHRIHFQESLIVNTMMVEKISKVPTAIATQCIPTWTVVVVLENVEKWPWSMRAGQLLNATFVGRGHCVGEFSFSFGMRGFETLDLRNYSEVVGRESVFWWYVV
jgi:hypothetical protein